MNTDDDTRARGLAKMKEVYGWDIEGADGRFMEYTVDHLFADVWDEGDLSVRDRRLILIGLAAGAGMDDVAGLQLDAAMRLDELSAEDLRAIVIFIAHYGGWPIAARLNVEVENVIGRNADG
jgi:4-carboxymuconolactone decarboxylase